VADPPKGKEKCNGKQINLAVVSHGPSMMDDEL